jgi:membrane-bound lytic murein transglycosylase D
MKKWKKILLYVLAVIFALLVLGVLHFKKDALPRESQIAFCGEEIPINRPEVKKSLQEAIRTVKRDYGKNIFPLRDNFLFSFIEEELRKKGLPSDLKYVAVIESALNPRAISDKGAGGVWQFMPPTAAEYKLKKDDFMDQRFDPFASTEAALTYLKELNDRFKNWADALAGYNMNQDEYAKAKFRQKAKDFYQVIEIPQETQEFVFKVIAAKLIMENPKEYGYRKVQPYRYTYKNWQIQKVPINVEGRISVDQIIENLKSRYPEWKSAEFPNYNSHILQNTLPTGSYYVYVKQDGTS